MNWEAIGSIGEIAGALGVIVTLLYLSRQIRESNLAARQAGTQEIQNQTQQFVATLGSTPQMSRLWVRGNINDGTLTQDELIQFRTLLMQMVMVWERTYALNCQDRLDPGFWETLTLHRRHLLVSPGFKAFYKDRHLQFNTNFQQFLNKEVAEASGEWRPMGVSVLPGEDAQPMESATD
ncbi:MAG: hypothetical protein O2971_07290 [Proteobacteria bacterium]|nr:hypothetical protein [Pseudomonadota bacterium]